MYIKVIIEDIERDIAISQAKEIIDNLREFLSGLELYTIEKYWKFDGMFEVVFVTKDDKKVYKNHKLWLNALKAIGVEWSAFNNSKEGIPLTYILSDNIENNVLNYRKLRFISIDLFDEKDGEVPKYDLREDLPKWINTLLAEKIPDDVKAFCFNIYEEGGGNWSLELVGTRTLSLNNIDWSYDEVTDFGTRVYPFRWKEQISREEILQKITLLLSDYLMEGKYATVLKEVQGVGIGFFDDDIKILAT